MALIATVTMLTPQSWDSISANLVLRDGTKEVIRKDYIGVDNYSQLLNHMQNDVDRYKTKSTTRRDTKYVAIKTRIESALDLS